MEICILSKFHLTFKLVNLYLLGKDTKSQRYRGGLPLSIFGDGELENDDSSVHQDVSNYNLASSRTDDIKKSQGLSVSISDLITSLYNQAERKAPVNHSQKPSENGLDSLIKAVDSNLVDGDGDLDDDSWEFKDAVSRTVDEQISVPGLEDPHVKHSTKCHLDNLKVVRFVRKHKVLLLLVVKMDLYNELHQDGIISMVHSENQPLTNIHLNEFIEVLQEPKFHVLEAEYQLSMRLLLAEKDWRSAIELLKHVASTSKVLKLGSWEEQSSFFFHLVQNGVCLCARAETWCLVPASSRYLHLERFTGLLKFSDPQPKFCKPFMLLSSTNPTNMFTLLSECFTLRSSSGLEEAVRSISDPTGFEYNVTPKELLESIKYIHDLDALALHNHVFSGQEPTYRLTLLSSGAVPDMKMVVWNGEHYFLPLANLWASLETTNPPNLLRLHIKGLCLVEKAAVQVSGNPANTVPD
ncbi:uncharacterized protein LOC123208726 [Mangifera indica]|uniref:uncharacterized protein LOC123208726 n=1 Tax=Mangifera indica TaxID=29780 RepID=UPI001CFA2F34|nr:uncharacterized protein LOC123208726 [Mangifera indica]